MVFTWIPNRRHENAATVLDGFNGLLQSDGYAAYSNLAAARSGLVLLACWSHVFRAFRDALADEPAHAKTAMHEIGRLYRLEAEVPPFAWPSALKCIDSQSVTASFT
jgi:transposase